MVILITPSATSLENEVTYVVYDAEHQKKYILGVKYLIIIDFFPLLIRTFMFFEKKEYFFVDVQKRKTLELPHFILVVWDSIIWL